MDKTKINALIRYSFSEIELHINALTAYTENKFADYQRYDTLLKDLTRIKKDLLAKYKQAVADGYVLSPDVDEQYDRDLK
tara:strand:+ start:3697 stop:3936 length:240 start_codon:yes stop_codon:yes gene_type:complete